MVRNSGKPFRGRPHTYTDFYEFMFSHCRNKVRRVFECGLGTNNPNVRSNMGEGGRPGASLRMWRDYFPNAQIVGADIDSAVLFTEDRITTEEMDVANLSVLIAEGTYTTRLKFIDLRIFIDRDYTQTLEARKRRGRDRLEPFVVDVLEREHRIISQHKSAAHGVVSSDFARLHVKER